MKTLSETNMLLLTQWIRINHHLFNVRNSSPKVLSIPKSRLLFVHCSIGFGHFLCLIFPQRFLSLFNNALTDATTCTLVGHRSRENGRVPGLLWNIHDKFCEFGDTSHPRHPVILSAYDWGVQSPPQHSI